MADWNCRKKISDYKKLYSKTSAKPILYQNAVTDNQQIAFVISLFWLSFAEVSIDDSTSTINSF